MPTYGGWTGKVLRVNLTTGAITSVDTIAKYKDFIGGEGLGLKVLWDEVPAGTDPLAPENKLIIGVGPLNGTGIPHAGRLSLTSLLVTNPNGLPGTGHAGGHFSSLLKFAGWDSIIVEGKSPTPVWIYIENENVEIRDARKLWGNGNFYTNAAIQDEVGTECVSILSIGQAGEKMYGPATMMCDRSHSGQNGAVMGSKNLKAIAVKGTGSVKLACSGKQLLRQIANHTMLTGGTSGGMTPKNPQPWAQFYGGGDWLSGTEVFWGGADAPISTGTTDPHDVHTYAYRGPGSRAGWNSNDRNMKWMVRGASCFGCPNPCHQALHVPEMATSYGYGDYPCNECGGISSPNDYYGQATTLAQSLKPTNTHTDMAQFMGSILADDYGFGDDYHIMTGDFAYYSSAFKGLTKAKLSTAEYNSINWAAQASGDPAFLVDLMRRIAFREGELGYAMGLGSYGWWKRWGGPPVSQMFQERPFGKNVLWNGTTWFAPHHFEGIQTGYIINSMYNRDPCMHEQTHFNNFTLDIDKRVFAQLPAVDGGMIGADAIDDAGAQVTPWNDAKTKLTMRLAAEGVIHNSQCSCNRGGAAASWFSPLAERGYIGDHTLDSTEYSMITGDVQSETQYLHTGLRIFTLLRALTIRGMGTKDMGAHDAFPDSGFDHPSWNNKAPFSPGTQRMDRADMDKGLKAFYGAMGWSSTGAPTRAAYSALGLDDVANELGSKGLLG